MWGFTSTLTFSALHLDYMDAIILSAQWVTVNWTGGANYVMIDGYSQSPLPRALWSVLHMPRAGRPRVPSRPAKRARGLAVSATTDGIPLGVLMVDNVPSRLGLSQTRQVVWIWAASPPLHLPEAGALQLDCVTPAVLPPVPGQPFAPAPLPAQASRPPIPVETLQAPTASMGRLR